MHITKQGLQKYTKELEQLIKALPAMIKETGAMAALGDRSENAGYINAKQIMRKTQARIRYLENLIKYATVIESTQNQHIQIGSKVRLKNTNNNTEETYTIVDSLEADPSKGFISYHSPLGVLLLNKKLNETVVLTTPQFTCTYVIISIK